MTDEKQYARITIVVDVHKGMEPNPYRKEQS